MSRRRALPLAALLLIATLCATLPLRIALDRIAASPTPLAARAVHGSIWHGTLEDVRIGALRLPQAKARLAFWPLLTGRTILLIEIPQAPAEDTATLRLLGFSETGTGWKGRLSTP